ncbi:MAG: LysR family transcriptional regulator [Chloroflexi bacterium]|nr:LysR family transcriptional regulator [Chloroflexota bacterium]
MELRDIRYFVAVASELHFGRAAQRLLISQPALSQQIRSLEAELGLRLLERNSKGVQLTAAGKAFLPEATAVVQQADHALEVARALVEGATGHLRLSHLRTMPRGLPERIVSEYGRRYPAVEIIPESGSTEQNVERIRAGQLDLAFVLAPLETSPELGFVEIATEPMIAAIPRAHPLSRRRRIRLADLVGIPLVWFPRHNSPGFYDSSLSEMYGDVTPQIVRTEPNEERMLIAVSEGAGITMLLAARTATLRFPGVVYRRFVDPQPAGLLALAFHQPPAPPARRFVDLAREMARL